MLNQLIEENQYYLFKYWNKYCDPRTTNQWLMQGGPWKLIAISSGYALSIVFGKRFMKNRAPYQIRVPMFLYNLSMILINVYFFYKSFWWINYGKDLLNFRLPSANDLSTRAKSIVNLYYYYLLSKFVDYFDTFFFILRKKDNQITALHVYHHISVPFVGWISNWICPTMPMLGMFTLLNSFCHILMYSYYALTALGPKIRPYLWWKPYITQTQLIQFVIIGLYGMMLNLMSENYPLLYRILPISQSFIYLVLFGQFYKNSYQSTNSNEQIATNRLTTANKDE